MPHPRWCLTRGERARTLSSMPMENIDYSPSAPAVHNTAAGLEALGAEVMKATEHFRREHFPAPEIDRDGWRVVLGGLVETPGILALADLKALPARTLPVVL